MSDMINATVGFMGVGYLGLLSLAAAFALIPGNPKRRADARLVLKLLIELVRRR